MKSQYSFKMRSLACLLVLLLIVSLFIADLFRIQVIKGEEYSSKTLWMSSANTKVSALRGEILDANGKALVYNVRSNTVYINASYFPKESEQEKRNEIICSLIRLFIKNGLEYNSKLPIELDGDNLVFGENSASDKAFLFKSDYLNLNSYATPQNCFDALKEYYKLENMTREEVLAVSGIYFAMARGDFSTANPFIFAEGVSDGVVLILKEQSRFYSGVEVRVDTKREFYDGTIAPHIIGFYDYINADEYKAKNDAYNEAIKNTALTDEEKQLLYLRAYGMTDKIGKFGIESAMESELRGTNGIMTTVTNADGSKNTSVTTPPVNGNNVILTFNGDYQKRVQDILAARIDSTKDLQNVSPAGSIVVMDVNSGAVLACATYPTYDLNDYKKNAASLNRDETAPLWNRALRSTYATGSTVKPAVAIAGLESGIITPETPIKCTIQYTFYKDQPFHCQNIGNHAGGSGITVDQAIRYSCNIFFFEVGRQLGIDKLGSFFSEFGLGSKTGVELTEATGVVAGPDERKAAGGIWYPGDTVQAAIGQSDNLFTPIQLASYVSTLANGGTRYKAHFIDSIKSADYSETIFKSEPVVLNKINMSPESQAAVKRGMIMLGETYTPFRNLPYKVACKTGTAQVKKKIDGETVVITNGFMISYAPAENPQIAVVIAIENATSAGLASYVSEAYEAYFNRNSGFTPSQPENTIL